MTKMLDLLPVALVSSSSLMSPMTVVSSANLIMVLGGVDGSAVMGEEGKKNWA